jgi:hypothetical protein
MVTRTTPSARERYDMAIPTPAPRCILDAVEFVQEDR